MATDRALAMLLAWTSPGYPVGAFSYSHGLEAAVEDGSVRDRRGLVDYVSAVIARGGGWVDAVLFARAYEAHGADSRHPRESGDLPEAGAHVRLRETSRDPRFREDDGWLAGEVALLHPSPSGEGPGVAGGGSMPLSSKVSSDNTSFGARTRAPTPAPPLKGRGEAGFDAIAELAVAFRGSAETALESRQMGRSFLSVTRAAWPHPALDAFADRHAGRPVAHCIAGALACAAHEVPLVPALTAWLHGTAANLVSAGVRLVPLGQTDGQIAIARLTPIVEDVVQRALATDLDDLGASAPLVELASLAHETQYTRLFRS